MGGRARGERGNALVLLPLGLLLSNWPVASMVPVGWPLAAPQRANPPSRPAPPAVLPGLWPSAALAPGARIDTSDTIDKVNRLQITAQGPSQARAAPAPPAAAPARGVTGGKGRLRGGLFEEALRHPLHAASSSGGGSHPHACRPAAIHPSTLQLQGIGSSARILQGDLAACGPLVVHIIDQVAGVS